MKTLEHERKAIFDRYGLTVPRGKWLTRPRQGKGSGKTGQKDGPYRGHHGSDCWHSRL